MSDHVSQITAGLTGAVSATAAMATSDIAVAVFGVPMAVVLAAFAGAMIALTFVSGLGAKKAVIMVVSGTIGASYLAPLTIKMAGVLIPGAPILSDLDKPAAFLLGLGFQVAVPVFMAWIQRKGAV